MTRLAYFLFAAAASGACLRATEQACTVDEQCSGGRCEPSGRCSFADPACAGGWRYGDGAGDLSGVCVDGSGGGDAAIDGDSDDAIDARIDAPAGDGPTDAPPTDGPIVDVIPHVRAQDETLGTSPVTFGGANDYIIDTTALTVTPMITLGPGVFTVVPQDGGGPDLALLRASTLMLTTGSSIRVVGSRPLVVLARNIELDGLVDAGARLGVPGPGGFGPGLGTGSGGAGNHSGSADSGGGGGGFGSVGGTGGAGAGLLGGGGGTMHGDPAILTLHGGSGGGVAYQSQACPGNGLGGGGGGAVQMYASVLLEIGGPGAINVGGGGGTGGTCVIEALAGGGGGSGGVIFLQSPMVINQGILAAKGGGGGGGGSGVNPGMPGDDGLAGLGAEPGGASGGANGGAGGQGSSTGNGGIGFGAINGGGGGGGGGRIVLLYRDNLAVGTILPEAVLATY